MILKFKKLTDAAVLPAHAKSGDAGMDITATYRGQTGNIFTYFTGLAVEIPNGYVGLLFPRSSIYRVDLSLVNCVGVIDSGYRGEIMFKFKIGDKVPKYYVAGNRVGQLVVIPYQEMLTEWADELSDTERGSGGFGSTGK